MTLSPSKIFAIGDIHGCYDKLTKLLERIPFDPDRDTIIFLGDYINRGPDSYQVIDYLVELRKRCRDAVFLKGNHEQMLLEYAATGRPDILEYLRAMGVGLTVESYNTNPARLRDLACFPPEHRDFLYSLEFGVIRGTTVFTHADITVETIPLLTGTSLAEPIDHVTETSLLSSRRLIYDQQGIAGYTIVFGHIPLASPLVLGDRICIDTGAVYGNMLTALELPSGRFYHA